MMKVLGRLDLFTRQLAVPSSFVEVRLDSRFAPGEEEKRLVVDAKKRCKFEALLRVHLLQLVGRLEQENDIGLVDVELELLGDAEHVGVNPGPRFPERLADTGDRRSCTLGGAAGEPHATAPVLQS